jgi:diguanylate cyclase
MRYTWRIAFSGFIFTFNMLANFFYLKDFSSSSIFTVFFNFAIGWFIGSQIDKYRFTKKKLGSTKTILRNYSYAMDSVGEAIGIINETGQFEFVNDAHAQLYGYTKEEFLKVNWKDCYSKEDIDHINNIALPKLLKTGYWKGEITGVRKDGTRFPKEISFSLIKESKNTICIVRDISEQKNYEELMKFAAEHHELTELPNRRRLLADLAAKKEEFQHVSLLFIDLDRFKIINDNLGHEKGDALLIEVSKRLLSFKNDMVNVYHHGGDEFIVIAGNTNEKYIKDLASEIIKKIKEPYYLNITEVFITASIGISLYPEHTNHINDLIKTADTAMYFAKLAGKNTFKFFNKELEMQLERKAKIEAELRKALKNKELNILYQPKFNLGNLELVGIEALIRWKHPTLGTISPSEFIPIAEEIGIINDIGKWVIKEILHQIRSWLDKGFPCVKVSVNISPKQFSDQKLVQDICSFLHLYQIDSKYLEIEITESVISEPKISTPILNSLKEQGIGISIDDFGTGYSSLSIIKDLPIDTLKIDQSFIHDLLENPKEKLLVMTIVEIGNILGLKVIAEGIETAEQLEHLLQLNCTMGQGYYFSKPISASELETRFFKQYEEIY